MRRDLITRRAALTGVMGAGGLILSGCDKIAQVPAFRSMLEFAERMNHGGQRLVLTSDQPLAREYQRSDITKNFKANGTVRPQTPEYVRLQMTGFSDYKLKIEGLVENPMEFSLTELKAMPSRTQITRHDCVEGWSAIGEWTGVQLSNLLMMSDEFFPCTALSNRCCCLLHLQVPFS